MSESSSGAPSSAPGETLGVDAVDATVVDPIRVPPWARELYDDTPVIARLFIGLAIVDVVGRLLGLLEPRIELSFLGGIGAVSALVPRDAVLLLPAILVLRNRDAATATPGLLRGAVVLAVVELAWRTLGAWFVDPAQSVGLQAIWSMLRTSLLVAGWVLIGLGLAALERQPPTPFVDGLANLVAIGLLAQLALQVVGDLWPRETAFFDPAVDPAILMANVVGATQLLAIGYVLRRVVRGVEDDGRPYLARMTGSTAAVLWSWLGLLFGSLTFVAIATGGSVVADAMTSTTYVVLSLLGGGWAEGILVLAFALGLGDPERAAAIAAAGTARPTGP
jgi:hypothetical protein